MHSPRERFRLDKCEAEEGGIGVVIVNWNGWRDSLKAYQSLLRSDFKKWQLIIVDNASTDESVEHLSSLGPNAILVANSYNAGFAGGCNLGIEKVRELGLAYVFLLNNDATVTEDTLGSLYLASKALSDSAALGSVVRYRDSGALQFFGSRTSPVSGGPNWFSIPADASQLNAEIIETDFVIGAAFFVPMSVLDKVGNFDERFYLNYEEVDWCYRARRLGVPSFVVTRSVVFHEGSASLGDWHAPMQTYFHARNRLLFYDKHTSIWQRIRGFTQVIWRGFKEVVWYAACRMNLKRSPNPTYELDPSTHALLLAIRDYMLRRFGDCPQVVRDLARKHRRVST